MAKAILGIMVAIFTYLVIDAILNPDVPPRHKAREQLQPQLGRRQ